jgi:uncharacterized delta-60 repeat protein
MKRSISIFCALILILYVVPLSAQWVRTYGGPGDDRAYSIRQTSDGGYIVAGYTDSFGANDKDAWVFKLNPAGAVEWQKRYGEDGDDQARSIRLTNDGGYVVAGWIYTGGMGFYPDDIWVYKLDSLGDFVWQQFNGDVDPHYHSTEGAYSVFPTSDGGYILVGERLINYEPPQAKSYRFNVLKVDADGQAEWQNFYGSSAHDDRARSVQETTDGGYIVAGSTESYGAGEQDFWILKLNSNGENVWQKTYGGDQDDYAESIQQTEDGGYIVAGVTESFGVGETDFWVIKLDEDGDIEWEKTYGGGLDEYAHSIQQTTNGGYIVVGATRSFGKGHLDILVLRLHPKGNVKWQRTFGGFTYESAFEVQQTNEGGFVVIGNTDSFGQGHRDVVMLKFDPNGKISTNDNPLEYPDVRTNPHPCDEYLSTPKVLVMETEAVINQTNSGGGGIFEWGETFIEPHDTFANPNIICLQEDELTLRISTTAGGTTDPEPGLYTYSYRDTAMVWAIPQDEYGFGGWTGDVPDSQKNDNPVTIIMDTSKSIRANFGRERLLTITSSNNGTTRPGPETYSYAEGTDVTVEAIPAAHSRFVRWSGDIPSGKNEENPITITMNRDKSIHADFVRNIYPPQGFSGEKVFNQSFSQDEYINILRWRRNPNNRNISKYRIYLLDGDDLDLVVELDANTFEYMHRNVDGDKSYSYALVAVDNENVEGEVTFTTIR